MEDDIDFLIAIFCPPVVKKISNYQSYKNMGEANDQDLDGIQIHMSLLKTKAQKVNVDSNHSIFPENISSS